MTILDDIIAYKKDEVAMAKANAPLSAIEALAREYKPRGFKPALERKGADGYALIAEIKKASPSKGLIRKDFNPIEHAKAYQAGGAACLSILTDGPSFQGSPDFLRAVRKEVSLPILRKDFTIDPYQIAEARAWGADCILLIMACLSDLQAAELNDAARGLELDVLVEVHDEKEMVRGNELGASLIGVNNRDLNTFVTEIATTARLAALAPANALLVSESGINDHDDIVTLAKNGAKAFLVGESLMRQNDIEKATRTLIESPRHEIC
ncbi:MAG: indole-3-glycerol phosphate synthase TrpC [Marinicaulis sp.]|nr:indole-3-glycerol phosphate synthase TrpC [Marinicaulis sp.]NNL88443.1 indole-3-glycerol phosphate synthase TrpC [Marinicaulis sp.]